MKKILTSLVAAFAMTATVSAQETLVKTIFTTDEPVAVSWETPLYFEASNFEDVAVGYFIQLDLVNTTDVIEIKSDGQKLPGSRFCWLGDNESYTYRAYITKDMLAALQATGLELCGANFKVAGASIHNDGFVMPDGAIWGGYFWVENWNTLELFKEAFNNYEGQRYLDVYLSADNGDNTNYVLNVRTTWGDDGIWAQSGDGQVERTTTVATIDLQALGISENIAERLNSDRLMIQGNPEGGNPFNFTAVALRHDPSGITDIIADEDAPVEFFNLQGVRVSGDLTPGLYIRRQGSVATKIAVK
ncbi:MAG: hypothetical protein ACI31C_02365 [Muribaculaceae bacterium]